MDQQLTFAKRRQTRKEKFPANTMMTGEPVQMKSVA